MILRLSDSLSRGLVVVSSVLLGLWLSFFGIRAAIARNGAEGGTANGLKLAVRLETENPSYWYFLGRYQQYNLEQPNLAMAVESYRKAIALNSLFTNAWLDLGMAYEEDGKPDQARVAYLEAKKKLSHLCGSFLALRKLPVEAGAASRGIHGAAARHRSRPASCVGCLFTRLPLESQPRRDSATAPASETKRLCLRYLGSSGLGETCCSPDRLDPIACSASSAGDG